MIFMLTVDGAFRTDIHLTGETVIRYLLLTVLLAEVCNFLVVGCGILSLFLLSSRAHRTSECPALASCVLAG